MKKAPRGRGFRGTSRVAYITPSERTVSMLR